MDDKTRDVQGQMREQDELLNERDVRFEAELKQAMARVNAPATLAKFLANAAEAEAARQVSGKPASGKTLLWFAPRSGGRVLAMPRTQSWMGGAIAAVLVLGSFGAVGGVHLRNERRQAEAQREFATAERIENKALAHAREQMEKAGVSLGE